MKASNDARPRPCDPPPVGRAAGFIPAGSLPPVNRLDPAGADESAVSRALVEYLAALEAGHPPARGEFLSRHPAIAGPLAECLDGLEFVRSAAPQLRSADGDPAAPPPGGEEALVGRPLGDFRILREIGRGGMGVVYEAEQMSLGRRVALKVLPFAATVDPRRLVRFQNEARAAGQLHHTNVVPVYAVGCERGVHYYAMPFIEGQTLAAMIADLRCQREPRPDARPADTDGPPTADYDPARETAAATPIAGMSTDRSGHGREYYRSVARLGEQAADALEHAHQMGVVHRDVKPANLLVDGKGTLWVTDFGLAQLMADSGPTLTGDLVGTLRYMSPEQALAKRVAIDHRTDVYSLGATLYELLTLRPAFDGGDRQELLRQIAFEEPVRPRRLDRAVPAELETIVLKALEKNPADRYATAGELADDLRRFLENQPIRARRPSLVQRAGKLWRRHPGVVRTAVAALLLGVVALGGATWRIAQEKAQTEMERDNARRASEAATGQRDRANGTLRLALDVLDKVYLRIAEHKASREPLKPEDRQFLQDALAFYEQFARDSGDDRAALVEKGKAYRRVGELYQKLGNLPEAEANASRALEIHRGLAESEPGARDVQAELSDSWVMLGDTRREAGRFGPALDAFRAAVAAQAKLGPSAARLSEYRDLLSECHHCTAVALFNMGRFDEAIAQYDACLVVHQEIPSEYYRPGVQAGLLANDLTDHAGALCCVGRWKEAETECRTAIALAEEGARKCKPEDRPEVEDYLSDAHDKLVEVLADTGRWDEAEKHLRQCMEIRTRVMTKSPNNFRLRTNFSQDWAALARCKLEQGKTGEVPNLLRKAIDTLRPLLKDATTERRVWLRMCRYYDRLQQALAETGKLGEAASAMKELPLACPRSWKAHLLLARWLTDHARELDRLGPPGDAARDSQQAYGKARAILGEEMQGARGDAEAMNNLAWTLALDWDPDLAEPARVVGLAQRTTELHPEVGGLWNTLGLARYRAKDYRGAIQAVEKSMALSDGGGSAEDWLILSMAYWQTGERVRSRTWYDRAAQAMDKQARVPEDQARLRGAAQKLLGLPPVKLRTYAR